jgi:hypothetical protein
MFCEEIDIFKLFGPIRFTLTMFRCIESCLTETYWDSGAYAKSVNNSLKRSVERERERTSLIISEYCDTFIRVQREYMIVPPNMFYEPIQ